MKAILEFNLPEDRYDYKIASNAHSLFVLLNEVDHKLRTYLKHGHDFKSADEAMEKIRDFIHENAFDSILDE